MSYKLKEYIFSSFITFLTGFLLVVTPELSNLTLESFEDGTITALLLVAVRAGIKGMFDLRYLR